MEWEKLTLLSIILASVLASAWRLSSEKEENRRETRDLRSEEPRRLHYQSKRHLAGAAKDRKGGRFHVSTVRSKDVRKKPPGHLTPLKDDDMDNDEVVSVAIGPPPIRPKFERTQKRPIPRVVQNESNNKIVTNFVKNILAELGRELMFKPLSEDYVFGQYVGVAMKSLTSDVKLKMQHDILELVMKYQKLNSGNKVENTTVTTTTDKEMQEFFKQIKDEKKIIIGNETSDDSWPDFSTFKVVS